ncbi:MAG: PKD domain-containing protein [Bacteroidetes bacterium]|nr:PKD domain-containing protein [Bacteroidota bacterium]
MANNNCEDLPIQFTDTSTVLTGTIISWNWDLGILGTFTSTNPIVTPTTPGNYPATLTVTTDQGCFATATNTLTVFEKPTASFSTNPSYGSPPFTLNILNTTTGAVNYLWDFGDGGTAVGITPIHIYPDTGIYNITLIATSIDGCIDSAQSVISVLIPKLDIGVRKIYATQDGSTIKLTAELINAGNVDITEFTLKGLIENNSSISEHWEGLFTPGTILLYTFNASYEVASTFIPSYYCIEALYPNDSQDNNSLNNKKCEVLNNEFELFSSYPNPFDEIINISFNLNTSGNYSVELYDDAGKIATEKRNIVGLKGFNTTTINTITLSKGTYSCVVRFREEIRVLKVVKLK